MYEYYDRRDGVHICVVVVVLRKPRASNATAWSTLGPAVSRKHENMFLVSEHSPPNPKISPPKSFKSSTTEDED